MYIHVPQVLGVEQRDPLYPEGQLHLLITRPLMVRMTQVPPFSQPHSSAGGGVVVACWISSPHIYRWVNFEGRVMTGLVCRWVTVINSVI